MSDEVKETVEDVNLETENTEQEEETESKESVVEKIKDKISSFFGGGAEEEEEVELPIGFAEATHELGWDDDEIIEFAKDYSLEELEEMIPFLIGEDSEESDETSEQDKDTKDKEVPEKKTDKKKDEDSQEDERIQKLLDRIEALEKAQGKSKEAEKEQETVNLVNRASQMFDEASEELEVFGKTEDLPKFPDGSIIPSSPQMKARSQVWETAWLLKEAGMDFDKAMSISLNSYKGENLKKEIHKKVIKDLKNKEKRLGGKRTSHETVTESLSGPDVIRQVARKHGKEIL